MEDWIVWFFIIRRYLLESQRSSSDAECVKTPPPSTAATSSGGGASNNSNSQSSAQTSPLKSANSASAHFSKNQMLKATVLLNRYGQVVGRRPVWGIEHRTPDFSRLKQYCASKRIIVSFELLAMVNAVLQVTTTMDWASTLG